MKKSELTIVVRQLKANCTLTQLQDLLKSKECQFSGTWDDIQEKRLAPALKEKKLSEDELYQFLNDVEEYGASHIFLYTKSRKTVKAFLADEATIVKTLKSNNLYNVYKKPILLENPKTLTAVSIRYSASGLTIKLVEPRVSETKIKDEIDGTRRKVIYDRVILRVVSVVRLAADGLLEISIGSRAASTGYKAELAAIIKLIKPIVDVGGFNEMSLSRHKTKLLNDLESNDESILLRNMAVVTDEGEHLLGVSKTNGSGLTKDVTVALAKVESDAGYCGKGNLLFRGKKDTVLERDIGVTLNGKNNEWAIDRQCSKLEHECILEQIRNIV